MRQLDSKQKRLIRAWFAKGDSDDEPYFAFMATWIAFNAWCYGEYADKANRQRADLKRASMREVSKSATATFREGSLGDRTAGFVLT